MNFLHPDDEVGLYTAVEEADFDHVVGLKGYNNLVTSLIVNAMYFGDNNCELNELPSGPSYSLTKLENELQDMTQRYQYKRWTHKRRTVQT